ncbi:MAG TPA: hypothetical protein VGG71_08115 [Chitinophagaceae bacterium]|jgi:hypothetical protein
MLVKEEVLGSFHITLTHEKHMWPWKNGEKDNKRIPKGSKRIIIKNHTKTGSAHLIYETDHSFYDGPIGIKHDGEIKVHKEFFLFRLWATLAGSGVVEFDMDFMGIKPEEILVKN